MINDGKIDSFQWDFSADGKNDLTTYEPYAENRFDTPYEGKVRVWACSNKSTFCGLGEIDIKVTTKSESRPTPPTSLRYEWKNPGEVELSWSGGGENADKWFLYVGDVPKGYMNVTQRSIIISDLDESVTTELTISSINSNESLESEKLTIKVAPRKVAQSGIQSFGSTSVLDSDNLSSLGNNKKDLAVSDTSGANAKKDSEDGSHSADVSESEKSEHNKIDSEDETGRKSNNILVK